MHRKVCWGHRELDNVRLLQALRSGFHRPGGILVVRRRDADVQERAVSRRGPGIFGGHARCILSTYPACFPFYGPRATTDSTARPAASAATSGRKPNDDLG